MIAEYAKGRIGLIIQARPIIILILSVHKKYKVERWTNEIYKQTIDEHIIIENTMNVQQNQ